VHVLGHPPMVDVVMLAIVCARRVVRAKRVLPATSAFCTHVVIDLLHKVPATKDLGWSACGGVYVLLHHCVAMNSAGAAKCACGCAANDCRGDCQHACPCGHQQPHALIGSVSESNAHLT
jgi:hypothetical protein